MTIYDEIAAERQRAHDLHGSTSLENYAGAALHWQALPVVGEEYGEVCRELNDARHDNRLPDKVKLRRELVQLAAMAAAWADNIVPG